MGHHKLFFQNPKEIREQLNQAAEIAAKILAQEKDLILLLSKIDQERFYIRYGFNSLSGFCRFGLKFSKTQTQRIVTQVRRLDPTDNFLDRRGPTESPLSSNPKEGSNTN